MLPFGDPETAEDAEKMIISLNKTNNTNYEIIVLHACDVGKEGGYAHQLSQRLPNVMIFAPSDKLGVSDEYDIERVENNGFWNVYYNGRLVNSFSGTNEETKALQFIWMNVPTQIVKEECLKQTYGLISPTIIMSNYINKTKK